MLKILPISISVCFSKPTFAIGKWNDDRLWVFEFSNLAIQWTRIVSLL